MNEQIFNKVDVVLKFVDTRISKMISDGKNFDYIISELELSHDRFKSDMDKIMENGVNTRYKYLFTHNEVIKKRITDIKFAKTLMYNYAEFGEYNLEKVFNLVKFREKISGEKIVVEVP